MQAFLNMWILKMNRRQKLIPKENIVGITLMLVQGCNLACSYCFGDEGSYCDSGKMSKETAF